MHTSLRARYVVLVVVLLLGGSRAVSLIASQGEEPPGSEPHIFSREELPPLGGDAPSLEIEAAMEVIHAYGREHSDAYGGAFVSGGAIFSGFVSEARQHLLELRARVTSSVPLVEAFQAEHTYIELTALAARIVADRESWRRSDVVVSVVSVDEYRNRVLVMVSEGGDEGVLALHNAYGGDALVVSRGSLWLV
jgi:hypothetical protein